MGLKVDKVIFALHGDVAGPFAPAAPMVFERNAP